MRKKTMFRNLILIILIISMFNILIADSGINNQDNSNKENSDIIKKSMEKMFRPDHPLLSNFLIGSLSFWLLDLVTLVGFLSFVIAGLSYNKPSISIFIAYEILIVLLHIVSFHYFYSIPAGYKSKKDSIEDAKKNMMMRYLGAACMLIPVENLNIFILIDGFSR